VSWHEKRLKKEEKNSGGVSLPERGRGGGDNGLLSRVLGLKKPQRVRGELRKKGRGQRINLFDADKFDSLEILGFQ